MMKIFPLAGFPTLRIFVTNSHGRMYVQSTRLSSPVIARYPLIQFGGKISLTKSTSNFAETMAIMPLPTTTILGIITSFIIF